jgi:hypothetical protein
MADEVQRVSVAGSWWRQAPHGSDPLWLASPSSSGRWQRGEKIAAIYLLPAPTPSRRTWAAFQAVGERLHSEGFRGVLYPSAARPEHQALCLFREEIVVPGAEPVRPPMTYRDPPAPPVGLRT